MNNGELANPLDLRGRTVLVTGASGGLGRATAVLASRLGARLVLLGRSVERLEETRAQLAGDGHICTVYDLHELAGLPHCLKAAVGEAGPLFGMAHCAGFLDVRPLRFLSDEAIEEMLRVNTLSAMALARAFRAKGVSTRPAAVVFVSSIMGLVGQPGQVAYSASKGALVALTRSLALEFATEGLRCNCVAPGVVEAGMTHGWRADIGEEAYARVGASHPLGFGTAEDVAHAIVFLLSDAARWITGTTLAVDGGYTAQ